MRRQKKTAPEGRESKLPVRNRSAAFPPNRRSLDTLGGIFMTLV